MRKITVYFKSRSTGQVYKTERHRNGHVTCFCPGFVYTGKCWHIKQAKNYKMENYKKVTKQKLQ